MDRSSSKHVTIISETIGNNVESAQLSLLDDVVPLRNHAQMDSPLPRVSIAVPSGDMVHADFARAYAELCMAASGLPLQLITSKSSIVAEARNTGVDHAKKFDAHYLLFLDSDMLFPPTTLFRLLLHGKDIVGATYAKRIFPFEALGTSINGPSAVPTSDLVEMQRIPTGCLLIKMSVFEKLTRPYFRFEIDSQGAIVGEDYVFCDRAREAGFRIWCDVTISRELGHLGQKIHRLSHASFPAVVADSTVAPPSGA